MPKSNADIYEEAEAELYGRAIQETESEVFHDALGIPEDDNDYDNELEQAEGWDGESLSLVEQAASMAGDTLYDRPLKLAEDMELIDQVEELRGAVAERDAWINEAVNGPRAREAARERFKENLYQNFGLMGIDDGRIDALRNTLAGAHAQVSHVDAQTDRVNRSLHAVRDEYGDESFGEAYQALIRAGQSGDRHAVNAVYHSANPGRALMNWHDGAGVSPDLGLGSVRNHAPRANRRMPERGDIDRNDGGWGHRDTEQEVFDSVFN